jgi:hypothetical protein
VTSTGSSAFAMTLATGAMYAVTVTQQPVGPSQTCTVANGAGTVASSNVTVSVTCTTNTYGVRGSLSGLLGTGLSLRLNGGAPQPVSGSAFTLSPSIASEQMYAVTVAQQPSNPWQTCAVTNGTGTIVDLDVTDVQVVCTTNVYTVGGTVTGLAGSGLQLTMNGATVPVTGTSFTFPAIPSGTAWAVTVTAQPTSPSQTCSVTGGTGTVTNANVTTVAVTCATNAFTVGGSITGLVGTGLTLSLNSGAGQTVNGTSFTLAPLIPSGQPYTVTVAQQPTTPSQTCTVTNGSSTVGVANVTSVIVTCTTNTYTVRGTISGLAGRGLQLSLNGGVAQAVSGASFTLTPDIVSGQMYSVSVVVQPTSPSQTCTVTNGSGLIGGANVSNVALRCVTNTYTVGGTIAGLTGAGLQLRLNGGVAQAVSGTSFTLTPSIPSGQPYTVTVAQQPTNPIQTCTVMNDTGTVGGANVTTVAVACTTNTYAVGGSITGLTGTGLQLRLNGGVAQTVSGTSFTLMPSIPSGQSYTVAIAQQPTTQLCTVTNGSGTVAGSNPVVSVTCVDAFSVGGTVTGLAGSGLTLSLNGLQTVSPLMNGSFSFLNRIVNGTGYSVSVTSSPPNQTCVVTTGSAGTVSNANVTSIVVTCVQTWSIGGNVTGLTGTGLQLSLNGGAATTISMSGSYTFPTRVLNGSTYSVVVTNQPTGQLCAMNFGSGTAMAPVNTVNVFCIATPASCKGVLPIVIKQPA